MLLASTLDDIDSIKPLLGINKDSRAYKKFPNLKTYENIWDVRHLQLTY